jgi:hypothetical protein
LDNYWAAPEALEAMESEDEKPEDVKLGKGLSDSASMDVKGKAPVKPIRTRVSLRSSGVVSLAYLRSQVTFTNAEIKQFKTLGLDPRAYPLEPSLPRLIHSPQKSKLSVFKTKRFCDLTRTSNTLFSSIPTRR